MAFLKLLAAGHLTIFLTRTPSAFWDKPFPSLKLFIPLEITQILGTLIAVYGILITPVGWLYAGIVRGNTLVWMLLLNGVKMVTTKVMNILNM